MNKKLILNLITLATTTLLLVLVVFSWYVTNREVRATGIMAGTSTDNFTLILERGEYDGSSWTWTETKSLSISNMQPGDAFFFRFRIESTRGGSLNVRLSNIGSNITTDNNGDSKITLGADDKSVLINGVKVYELANNAVTITEYKKDSSNKDVVDSTHTLYTYSGGEFNLSYYLIQDTFKYYDYGTQTGTTAATFTYDDDVTNSPNAGVVLTNISKTYSGLETGVSYGYFALEFNDELSTKSYMHIDNKVKSDSNLYQAQTLVIGRIGVEEITTN